MWVSEGWMSTGYGTWATLWIEALQGLLEQERNGVLGTACDRFVVVDSC